MIQNFQMVDQDNGYALREAELYKTTDGGASWTMQDLPPNTGYETLLFTSATTGWLTCYNENNACLLKTEDGGATFTEFTYLNISQSFTDLIVAENGDLYAGMVSDIFGNGNDGGIARSTDDGETFERIFTAAGFSIRNLTVQGERLYLTDNNGIRTLTRNGELISTNLPINSNPDLTGQLFSLDGQLFVINDERMLYNGGGQLEQSFDGGATWSVLHDDEAKILGGDPTTDGVLLLLKTGECPQSSSVPWPITAIAVLKETLEIGPDMLELETEESWTAQYAGNGRWFLAQYQSDFYEIFTP